MSNDNQPSFVLDQSLTVVANGQYFAGGINVAPNARLDSGAFEIMVLKKTPKLQLIGQLPLVYRGAHAIHPNIAFFSGRRVVAETVADEADRPPAISTANRRVISEPNSKFCPERCSCGNDLRSYSAEA